MSRLVHSQLCDHRGGAMGSFLRLLPGRIVGDCPVILFLFVDGPQKGNKRRGCFFLKWQVYSSYPLLTAKAPENRPRPNRKGSYSKHPFLRAMSSTLVSGRVDYRLVPFPKCTCRCCTTIQLCHYTSNLDPFFKIVNLHRILP